LCVRFVRRVIFSLRAASQYLSQHDDAVSLLHVHGSSSVGLPNLTLEVVVMDHIYSR